MSEDTFYPQAQRGLPGLLRAWLTHGRGDSERLAVLLADTARIASLGQPASNPDGETLEQWAAEGGAPLWAPKAALFLLMQMPARPVPQGPDDACAWAYCWLRMREHDSPTAALMALPEHLRQPLAWPIEAAWQDLTHQRLI